MKKISAIILLMVIAVLSGCGGDAADTAKQTSDLEKEGDSAVEGDAGFEIAMIIDSEGSVDDRAFNQGTWEGIKKYAAENDVTYQHFQVVDDSDEEYLNCIELAVGAGAKIIICPSYMFEVAIYHAQDKYPDVKFMIIDGRPQAGDDTTFKTAENTYSVIYAEEQAGFLAGYAAVKDGYRRLSFMGGMAVPAVVRFGYGFVQGADFAAEELGLDKGAVEITYSYTGNFDATPDNQNKAASWYQAGTEIIFACGGAVGQSVFAAAEANGGKAIGVDVDQAPDSETVITSAVKQLSITVNNALSQFYAGAFPGGVDATLGVESDGIGLTMDTARFETFTKADYDAIYKKMVENDGDILDGIVKDTEVTSADQLPCSKAVVKVVE